MEPSKANFALANAELAVMEQLWGTDRLTAKQLQERLYPDAQRSQHGTVQRLLQRLEEKGLARRDRSLPVHYFEATISREAYAGGQLETPTRRLTSGSIAPLISHLVENGRIDSGELKRLRSILDSANSPEEGA